MANSARPKIFILATDDSFPLCSGRFKIREHVDVAQDEGARDRSLLLRSSGDQPTEIASVCRWVLPGQQLLAAGRDLNE